MDFPEGQMTRTSGREDISTKQTKIAAPDARVAHVRICGSGRREWHKESGYRQQARVENGFFRYKSLLGGTLKARKSNAQMREVVIGCHILNRMAALGRPESYAVVS